jgi:hypothetical protein
LRFVDEFEDFLRIKDELPFNRYALPFLSFFTYRNSSLASVSSFCKIAFSDVVLLRADHDRSIYRFTGVSRVEERTIEVTSDVASRSSVTSGGELSSRERSRSFGVVIGGGVTRRVGVGIRRVERIVIGLSG